MIFREVFKHDSLLLGEGKLDVFVWMGEVCVSEGGGWWIGSYIISFKGLQEDVIDDCFVIIDDCLLYVVIDCEGETFSEKFEDGSIVEWIAVMMVLSKYRGEHCIWLDRYHIACWWCRGDRIVSCLDYM